MDSALHPYGAFWLFSGITLLSAVVFLVLMKETRNLTDKQKKELYRKFNFKDYKQIQFVTEKDES